MPLYEHTFLARQDLSQAQVDALAATATEIVEANAGKVTKTETWGLKNLAYKIKAQPQGAHFVMLNIEAPAIPLPSWNARPASTKTSSVPHRPRRRPRGRPFGADAGTTASAPVAATARRQPWPVHFRRRKSCPFSGKNAPAIDYKGRAPAAGLHVERGKIVPSRITAVSAKKQRELGQADQNARHQLGLLPLPH